jgi:hypothetical protein
MVILVTTYDWNRFSFSIYAEVVTYMLVDADPVEHGGQWEVLGEDED